MHHPQRTIRVVAVAILPASRRRVEAIRPETKDPASPGKVQTPFTKRRAFLQAAKSSKVIVSYLRSPIFNLRAPIFAHPEIGKAERWDYGTTSNAEKLKS